jgi:MoaA/NifB/PqqE/SkfB family radical SAM enzyme
MMPVMETEGRLPQGSGEPLGHAVLYPLLACNARCPFCSTRVYAPGGPIATSDFLAGALDRSIHAHTLSLDEAKARYAAMRAAGVTRANLQGGEPTIYPGLFELIAHGLELGFEEQIVVTNGRKLAEPAFAERLSRSGISTIALSLFGHTAALHDESLGVDGAFEDLVRGVRNLAALPPGGAHLTGQLTLHARNFEALPEMLAFWHAEGLRYFAVRLLRDVASTRGQHDRWFFDLARLKPKLERAIELAGRLEETRLLFPEIFYCLLGPERIGEVLGDLAAARRIAEVPSVVGKFAPGPERRRLPRADGGDACARCDLRGVCSRPEPPYTELLSAPLRPISVAAEVESLVATSPSAAVRATLRASEAELQALGVAPAMLAALRLPAVPTPVRERLATLVGSRALVVRFVPIRSLGVGRGRGPVADDLHTVQSAQGARGATARFVLRSEPLLSAPELYLATGEMETRSGRARYVVVVFDDTEVDEAAVRAHLGLAA